MTQEQEQLLELLKAFARICEERGLTWYLAGGTLLGAVRHRGFIPWDDDVDVMMPEKDYERFVSLGAQELPAWLAIQSERTDERYPFLFAKLCDTGKPFLTKNRHGPLGLYVDVFPLIESKAPGRTAAIRTNILCVLCYALQVKCGWTDYVPYKRLDARALYRVASFFPAWTLRRIRNAIVASFAGGTDCLFSPAGLNKGVIDFFEIRWFNDVERLDFEGEQMPSPCGWHEYLTLKYGDYQTLPPEEQRMAGHM